MKPENVPLPEAALSETFLASTGPGGQNVNKVATACQLRCDVFALGLPPYAYEKLKVLAGSKLTQSGELIITARTHRSQEANREEARRRLRELIAEAYQRNAKRRATKPSRAAKAKRIEVKKGRGAVKAMRGKVGVE
jgi:ribosome-associated protein